MNNILHSIRSFFNSLPESNLSLLIALSGGSDSVALLCLLHELRQQLKIKRLAAAHVNHGLRDEESDGDESFVVELCGKLGVELFRTRLENLSPEQAGIEEIARKERYAFLSKIKEEQSFDYIVTGHTLDDQAETVLFRLIRGSGFSGMRGIHPVRADGIIRPLLSITKAELLEWLEKKKIDFRLDSSNRDIHFKRNYIRHEIIPAINKLDLSGIKKIAAFAEEAGELWPIINREIQAWKKANVISESENGVVIKKNGLSDAAVASSALNELLKSKGVSLSRYHILEIINKQHCTSGQYLLPDTWSYFLSRDKVFFFKGNSYKDYFEYLLAYPGKTTIPEQGLSIQIVRLEVPQCTQENDCAFLDEELCGDKLLYRKIKSDDYFTPLGRNQQVNVLKFLSKQGLSRIERELTGVIVNFDNKIVWILGIRIDNFCRVTVNTRRVIKISINDVVIQCVVS